MDDSTRPVSVADPQTAEDAPGTPAWIPARDAIVEGPLDRTLWKLAGPAILANVLHTLLALVAVFWVGRLGAAPTAAVTTGFFASWILLAAADLTALGILAHVSRHIGANDRARAGYALSQGLLLGVVLGSVIAVVSWFVAPALFRAIGADPEVTRHGIVYFRVLFAAAPLTFTFVNCEFAMRAAGNTRTPMLIVGGMVLLNAILDPFLIYGLGPFPRLEVLGAAISAVIAQAVAVAAFAWRAAVRDPSFPFDVRVLRRLDLGLARNLMAIGVPGMAVGVLYSAIYLFMSGIVARIGTLELAVLGLANRAEAITYLVTKGFGAATATMVGQNLGAGRPDRAARAASKSALWMGIYSVVTASFLVFWPEQLLALFTSDRAVIETGAPYLRILGYAQPLMALEIVYEHAFTGAGDNIPPMIVSVPINALRVPLILWVQREFEAGLLGIGWVLAITCMLRGVLAMAWWQRGGWKNRQL